MKKALFGAVAAIALMASPVMAGPITGNLSISGTNNVNGSEITFAGPQNLQVSNGDFSALGSCIACVDVSNITFSPEVSSGQLFTVTNNGLTASFMLDAGASVNQFTPAFGPGVLFIIGNGTASLTGFDDTPGALSFTTQNGIAQNVTFSATVTAVPVPEPASLALFGTALLGMGLVRRVRRNNKV